MRTRVVAAGLLAGIALVYSGCSKPAGPEAESLDQFQGRWKSVEPTKKANTVIINVQNNAMFISEMGAGTTGGGGATKVGAGGPGGPMPRGDKANIATDSAHNPKHIDFFGAEGADEGRVRYGIYEFEGDRLKIAIADYDQQRPTSFTDTEHVRVWYLEKMPAPVPKE